MAQPGQRIPRPRDPAREGRGPLHGERAARTPEMQPVQRLPAYSTTTHLVIPVTRSALTGPGLTGRTQAMSLAAHITAQVQPQVKCKTCTILAQMSDEDRADFDAAI